MISTASAVLTVSDSTTGIVPGRTGVIILSLVNGATDIAYDTKIVLKSLDAPLNSSLTCNECIEYSTSRLMCFTFREDCYTSIGDIYGSNGQEAIFSIIIPENTKTGVYVAEFEIHYSSKNATTGQMEARYQTKKVAMSINSINVKPDINVNSVIMPETISPGDEFNISITIKNTGEVNARNVNLELITSDFKAKGGTNKESIGNLNINETSTINYTLLASASLNPGVYDLRLNATYSDESNSYSKVSSTGVLLDGLTDFNIFIQDISPDIITSDTEVSALISIANTGVVNAESVSVKLNPNNGITLSNNNEDFLGTLDVGDFTTTSFKFTPNNEGEINLNLTLSYTTPSGKRTSINTTQRIIIRFQDSTIKRSVTPNDVISVMVYAGVIIAVIYFYIKVKRKKK